MSIRLIELFSGYGSQALALKYLGVEFTHWRTCEWATKSIQAYNDLHIRDYTDYSKEFDSDTIVKLLAAYGISMDYNKPMTLDQIKRKGEAWQRKTYNNIIATHNLVNISKVNAEDLNIVETDKYDYIMTYSYPCVLAGTKIITNNGYKNIEDIKVNDKVLTHKNRFCKVNKIMNRISNHYYTIKALGVPKLYLTEEHPLYVLRDNEVQWVKVKDLRLDDKISFNINRESKDISLTKEQLWLLGRYVADGFINKRLYNSTLFAIGFKKEQDFLNNIPIDYKNRFKKFKKACWEYRLADKDFQEKCSEFGNGALNKKIPQWIIDLPKDKLQSFFNGYISGDGHVRKRGNTQQIMFTTVSENLYLGMQQIIAKLYNCICSCSIRTDDRKETFNDSYNCQFNVSEKHIDQVVIDNKIFVKINNIIRNDIPIQVFNFEVDKDNSYTCQNVIVHNCQDISLAGKGAGMEKGSGTRSSLLWEVERLLNDLEELPQMLVMENVPQVNSPKNRGNFEAWQQKLKDLGYTNYIRILNAKDYAIPQNRQRCFMISILGNQLFNFPKGMKLTNNLSTLLDPDVDDKFIISNTKIKEVIKPVETDEITLKQVVQLKGKFESTGRVYSVDGLAPTINTCGGGQREPKILITKSNNKRLIKLVENTEFKENETLFLDAYNQAVKDNIAGTITTRISDSNAKFVYNNSVIRKLTPKECWRLMGVKDSDYENVATNQSNSSLYHLAGDSIVTTVLMGIFGELLGIWYENKIIELVDSLKRVAKVEVQGKDVK